LAVDQLASKLFPVAELMEDRNHRCPHCGEPTLRLVADTARPSLKCLVASTYRLPPLHST
jgi:hypothetical protein